MMSEFPSKPPPNKGYTVPTLGLPFPTNYSSVTLLLSTLGFFTLITILEAVLPVEAIECFVYKHVDELAAVGLDATFAKTVECGAGVNSCLQWKGYYPLESHPVKICRSWRMIQITDVTRLNSHVRDMC
jgi:hypothetical protein